MGGPGRGKWIQVNFPRVLIEKIDKLIEDGSVFYANRNQFCTSVLINEVNKIIERIENQETKED